MKKNKVTFLSPGTLFSEQTTQEIPEWDPGAAAAKAKDVRERYNARPYAFFFTTVLTADPIPDGEGGTLRVAEREVAQSGVYHINGTLITLEEAKSDPEFKDLSNLMFVLRYDHPVCVVTQNSFRHVAPFKEGDYLVDLEGKILRSGNEPALITYRSKVLTESFGKESESAT